ncbi:MAG TPA: hypothetical protein VI588_03490, partial [Candidatus Gracilibacteria bacterium]|nr:hypothetical protein [Candidatus Gracilibacteria bacterium]
MKVNKEAKSEDSMPESQARPVGESAEPKVILGNKTLIGNKLREIRDMSFGKETLLADIQAGIDMIKAVAEKWGVEMMPLDDTLEDIDLLRKMIERHEREEKDPGAKDFHERRGVRWLCSTILADLRKVGTKVCDDVARLPAAAEEKTESDAWTDESVDAVVAECADVVMKTYEAERQTVELAEKKFAAEFKVAMVRRLTALKEKRGDDEKIKSQYDLDAIAEFITQRTMEAVKKIMSVAGSNSTFSTVLYESFPTHIKNEKRSGAEDVKIVYEADRSLQKLSNYTFGKVTAVLMRAEVLAMAAYRTYGMNNTDVEDSLWNYMVALDDDTGSGVKREEEEKNFSVTYEAETRKKTHKDEMYKKLHEFDPDFIVDFWSLALNNGGLSALKNRIKKVFPHFFTNDKFEGGEYNFALPEKAEGEWSPAELQTMNVEYIATNKRMCAHIEFLCAGFMLAAAERKDISVEDDKVRFSSVEAAVSELERVQGMLWRVAEEHTKQGEKLRNAEKRAEELETENRHLVNVKSFLLDKAGSLRGELLGLIAKLETADRADVVLRKKIIGKLEELKKKTGRLSRGVREGIETLQEELRREMNGEALQDMENEEQAAALAGPHNVAPSHQGIMPQPQTQDPYFSRIAEPGESTYIGPRPALPKPTFGEQIVAAQGVVPTVGQMLSHGPNHGSGPAAPSVENIVDAARERLIQQRLREEEANGPGNTAPMSAALLYQPPLAAPTFGQIPAAPASHPDIATVTAPLSNPVSNGTLPFRPISPPPAPPYSQPGSVPQHHTQPPAPGETAPLSFRVPAPVLPFIPRENFAHQHQ